MTDYDVVVVGAGTAGLTAARLLARRGRRVALIERDEPGGDCLHTGCVPTKALIHVAGQMHNVRSASRFGIHATDVRLDFNEVREHVARAQEAAGRADSEAAIASWGASFIRGNARFTGPHTLDIDGRSLSARHVIIAAGSQAALPPIDGIDELDVDTNVEAVHWTELPRSIAIVGGGAIGAEFSQMLARFDVQVTLLESDDRILVGEDPAASAVAAEVLAEDGVWIETGVRVNRLDRSAGGLQLAYERGDTSHEITAQRVLIATGRKPRVGGLNLDAAGVRVGKKGIAVTRQLRTSQTHIFAVGDVNGGPQFTHVAEDQGRFVANLLTRKGIPGSAPAWNGRVVPRVTFTDPEIASVGMTEAAARARYGDVEVATLSLDQVDRALTSGQTRGFLKFVTTPGWQRWVPGLTDKLGGEIVGATLVAPNAGDLLMPVVLAMRARLPVGLVALNMQAYPTMALGIRQALGARFDE